MENLDLVYTNLSILFELGLLKKYKLYVKSIAILLCCLSIEILYEAYIITCSTYCVCDEESTMLYTSSEDPKPHMNFHHPGLDNLYNH